MSDSAALSRATTDDLRAELHRREDAERKERWAAICAAFPCPECGADPTSVNERAVEEFRFAPRAADGEVMLYAPYESAEGTTGGMRFETTVVCANGHEWSKSAIRWFDEPRKGPPILSSGGSRG